MYRQKIEKLTEWKNDPFRKPLILYGARQVGKTYLVRDIFAKENYENYIYIDLAIESEVRRFIKNHVSAEEIIRFLSLRYDMEIDESTLIIFDEIQECIPLITSLKYFCQDYRSVPVIATGSMVRIRLKQTENNIASKDPELEEDSVFLFPVGKVDELHLYPLTFSEFMQARNKGFYQFLKNSFEEKKALENEYHEMAMKYFFEYMVIGGMPEVTDMFLKTNSYRRALSTLKTVYSNYLNDMSLYQIGNTTMLRTRRVFENVYAQLAKENKNFKISAVEKGKKLRDYYQPIDWLREAGILYPSYQCKERVTLPLGEDEESLFRLYLSDCSLFALQSGISVDSLMDYHHAGNMFSGIFFENYVADELTAHGKKLFYWKGKTSSELEFLLEDSGNIIPIDAKKNKGSLKSLAKYKEMNSCSLAIKVSQNHYGYHEDSKLLTLPYYYFSFYLDSLE